MLPARYDDDDEIYIYNIYLFIIIINIIALS